MGKEEEVYGQFNYRSAQREPEAPLEAGETPSSDSLDL